MLVNVAALTAFTQFHVAARIFDFKPFEARHGDWPEFLIWAMVAIPGLVVYSRLFKADEARLERQRIREDLIQGRIKRQPLWKRALALLTVLAIVSFGLRNLFIGGASGTPVLIVMMPIFLLLVLMELQVILQPGDALIPDPHDELLAYFRSKTLKVGYSTAVISLAILTVLTIFIPHYVGLLLPVFLVASLLVPAFFYRRLDRKAETTN